MLAVVGANSSALTHCLQDHRFWQIAIPIVAVAACVCGSSGCATLSSRNPVERNVLAARHSSQQGMAALDRGHLVQAEQYFSDAIAQCPDNIDARCQLSECLWKRGAHNDAIDHLSEALANSENDDTQMLVRLGQMKLEVGEIEDAQALVQKALHSSPDAAQAWQLDGSIRYQQGRYQEALASYQRSLSHAPENVETQLAIAEIYHRLERPGRTLATLTNVERSLPAEYDNQRQLTLKGTALNRLTRYEEAVSVLTAAIQTETPSPELMEQLAFAQIQTGRYQQARQTIRRALPLANSEQNRAFQQLMTQMAAKENRTETQVR